MSYLVFALKWRPKNFDELLGQEQVTTTLKNSLQKNRLAHAYLFAGPRGVGKTSTARIFAKSLNCKEGMTVNPCQVCASCVEISQARSLDVIEIDGASNRGIDEIRTLRENVKFAPVSGKFKIYIIDEVHMLTTEAFNALLKTLEEPPAFVKFIFATTAPHKIPATILSRCQRFDFKRIPLMRIVEQLEKITAQEKIEINKEVVFSLAKASDGSLRDAEALLDQLISFSKEKISLSDVIAVLGIVQQETLFNLTDKIIQKNAKGALEILNSIVDSGKDPGLFLNNLIEHFRNLMISKVTKGDSGFIDLPQDLCERLLLQSQSFSLEEVFSFFNILVNTQEMAKRLDSLRIPLEIGIIKLAHNKVKSEGHNFAVPPEKKKEQNKEPISAEKKPLEDDKPADPPPEDCETIARISMEDIKGRWQEIVHSLGKIKISAATYLNEGMPLYLTANALTVSFPKNLSLHKEALERKENKSIVEKVFSDLLKTNLRLSFVLSNEEAKDKSEASPVMKSILDTFNARTIKEE